MARKESSYACTSAGEDAELRRALLSVTAQNLARRHNRLPMPGGLTIEFGGKDAPVSSRACDILWRERARPCRAARVQLGLSFSALLAVIIHQRGKFVTHEGKKLIRKCD
ncbi:hypothetical protein EXIGLDRAFT_458463 [Exidia glandulosa HHB12029]|uniref:Uncharacterized protein n=1 Tax=Exidia glandulosa HHB12029 TaxID=1314781 RepID=A0A165PPI2_EXIGL|nr:hypothetical protein EXIGLDRAFT_458463 [Exidia glandulosa HHB12029]